MKTSIRQKLFLLSFITLAGNGILSLAVYKSYQKLRTAESWVSHTEQVINQSAKILAIGKDIETPLRGFVLTNDTAFLRPLSGAQKNALTYISQLRTLTVDNPTQQKRIDSLEFYVHERLDISFQAIEMRRKAGMEAAMTVISTKQNKLLTHQILKFSIAIQQEEGKLLRRRTQANKIDEAAFNRFTVVMFILMACFTILLLVITGKYLFQNREKEKRSKELSSTNQELSIQIEENEQRRSELNKAKNLYAFMSQVNQDIAHVKDEEALFKNACRIALEFGKFTIAWIGLFDIANNTISNVSQTGMPADYLDKLENAPLQKNIPQQRVLTTGEYFACNNILNDAELENWTQLAIELGVNSCLILPIGGANQIIGTLNLYAAGIDFFDKETIALLQEVTADISFTLNLFEKEKLHSHTKELLAQNESRFRALIENSVDMITLSTVNGQLIYGSSSVTKGLGYSAEELLKLSVFDIIHPDEIALTVEKTDRILQVHGESFYYQQRRLHKNGNWIWCEGTLTNMLHEPGIYALVSNFRDISERKRMEQQQEFDGNNLDALINNTNDLMWSVDKSGKLLTFNQPFYNVVRLTSGKEIKKGDDVFSVVLSADQFSRFKIWYDRAFTGENFSEIDHIESPVESWSEISFYPIVKGNEVMGAACHSRDITERKKSEDTLRRAEENLQRSEASLKKAQSIARMGNFEIDMVNYTEIWSDEIYEILGVEQTTEPLAGSFSSFIHPDDLIDSREAFKSLKDASMEHRMIRNDGIVRYVNSEWRFEFDQNKKPIRLYGVLQDITERKLAEIERIKMVNDLLLRNTDLEQFGYIISHNLRSPVANIIGASEALNDSELTGEDKEILARGINTSVTRLDNVVKDLNHILDVKGEFNKVKEIVHFSTLVNDIKLSIQHLISNEDVEIKCDFSEINEFLTLRAYLYSIFYNLISNSIKYRRQQVPALIEISSLFKKNKLELTFTDNGMGINLEKSGNDVFGLYKRFHTNIEGKGMGLFMVKTQVEALGGKISIRSRENEGTEFRIEFELSQ